MASDPHNPHRRSDFYALVADDLPTNRLLLSSYMSTIGFKVDEASGGPEAMKLLSSNRYDLVLLDWHMPVVDGLEVVQRIRHNESDSSHHTPIVIVTASSLPTDRQLCLDMGADDFLTKPISVDQLTSVANSLVISKASETNSIQGLAHQKEVIDDLVSQVGPSTVAEVIGVFLSDLEQRHKILASSISAGDMHSARREAHTIKSPGYMLGATCLSQLCETIESGQYSPDLISDQIDTCIFNTRLMLQDKLTELRRGTQ